NAGRLDGKRPRHLGIAYVFNAPKSSSVYWAFADPHLQKELQAAFDRAVARTVREYIEPEVARCRLADGTEVPARIVAAQFTHITSREGDMHYHAHLAPRGTGLCPDGNTRALVSKRFYEHKLDAGAYMRLALEYECRDLQLRFYRPLDGKHEPKQYTEV